MKTLKQILASACVVALFAFTVTPSFAQSMSADAEFAHFDGADALSSSVDPVSVLNTVGDAQIASAVSELRQNPPSMSGQQWKSYGEQLEIALASDHLGVQNAALRLVIAYSDNLNLSSEAVVDVMRLYREGSTEQVRRMAVVSLSQINSSAAIGFLRLSFDFEKSETVKSTIGAVLNDFDSNSVI